VVGFIIGSRGKVPGKAKTCDKRRNNNLVLYFSVLHQQPNGQ
jgi:hypothetical protein